MLSTVHGKHFLSSVWKMFFSSHIKLKLWDIWYNVQASSSHDKYCICKIQYYTKKTNFYFFYFLLAKVIFNNQDIMMIKGISHLVQSEIGNEKFRWWYKMRVTVKSFVVYLFHLNRQKFQSLCHSETTKWMTQVRRKYYDSYSPFISKVRPRFLGCRVQLRSHTVAGRQMSSWRTTPSPWRDFTSNQSAAVSEAQERSRWYGSFVSGQVELAFVWSGWQRIMSTL